MYTRVCVFVNIYESCFLGSKLCRFHLNFSGLTEEREENGWANWSSSAERLLCFGTPGLQFIKVTFEPLRPCLPWSLSFFLLFSQLLLVKPLCGNDDVSKSTVKSKSKIPRSLPSLVIYKVFNCTHLFGAHVFKIDFILWIMKTVVQNCHSKIGRESIHRQRDCQASHSSCLLSSSTVQLQLILEVPKCSAGRNCVQTQSQQLRRPSLPAKHSARHCPTSRNTSPWEVSLPFLELPAHC